jgi:hypothetical protein
MEANRSTRHKVVSWRVKEVHEWRGGVERWRGGKVRK